MNLNNVRVAPKLWGTIMGLLLVLLLSNLWVSKNTQTVLQQSNESILQIERKIAAAHYLRGTALAASEIGIAHFATNEPRVQAELRKRLTDNVKVTIAAFEAMDQLLSSEGERAQYEHLMKIRGELRDLRANAEKNLDKDDFNARANFAFGAYVDGADAYYKSFDHLIDYQEAQREVVLQQADASRERNAMLGWGINLILLVVGVVLARWLVGSIHAPLQDAVALTKTIGDGNLNMNLKTNRQDEFGQLLHALNEMAGKLRSVIGEVRTGVDAVSAAAGQIASGNQDLSVRTEQSAASLQQTAASIEEMNASVNQAADTSRQANQLAATAAQAATRGGEVVQQVVQSMEHINTSSRKISDIIGVIDGIAFQTNILALNAAVEAARAGEQGRGFAVVAGEVRSLAGRSAEAAKEIKALISASVSTVETGSVQVAQAGSSMQEIVSSVRRVADLIGEITAAASEQREGFSQVNHAVSNLDQMTQQNAALVEESSAAAKAMSEQAKRLLDVVSVFDVGHSRQQSIVHTPAPAVPISPAAVLAHPARPVARSTPAKPASLAPSATQAPVAKPPALPVKPMPVKPVAAASDDEWETF